MVELETGLVGGWVAWVVELRLGPVVAVLVARSVVLMDLLVYGSLSWLDGRGVVHLKLCWVVESLVPLVSIPLYPQSHYPN
jgi:hypothetical protein